MIRATFFFHDALDQVVVLVSHGQYCADIPLLAGCCGYGQTADEALSELEGVKETVLQTWREKGKRIPEPMIRIEMPADLFARLSCKEELLPYILPP